MRALALVLMVGFLGCGSGSSSSSSSSATKAQADCTAFIAANYCPKLIPCYAGFTQPDCVAAAETGLDCAAVTSESGELGTCESQLGSSTCAVLVDSGGNVHLPAACTGVFLHP